MLELSGKIALVLGVASEDSIAWATAKRLAEAGCTIHLGFQKRFMSRVYQLKNKLDAIKGVYPLDVANEESTLEFFDTWQKEYPNQKASVLIHAIGWAPRSSFDRHLLFVEEESLNQGMSVSAHSLQRVMKYALPHLSPYSSTVTFTYAASTRYVPNYSAMSIHKAALEAWVRELAVRLGPEGHRVNAISAGPIRTLAASGIPGFDNILNHVESNAPLRRNVSQDDVAGAALWLSSPLSKGVTAQVIHVDAGFSSIMVPETIMSSDGDLNE